MNKLLLIDRGRDHKDHAKRRRRNKTHWKGLSLEHSIREELFRIVGFQIYPLILRLKPHPSIYTTKRSICYFHCICNPTSEPLKMSALSWFSGFLYSQLLVTPPTPVYSFAEQTVIVTGSNTGLGLEAARHITRLNATKVILAVRNISKGEAAKRSIEESTGRSGVIEVWPLDLSSYESVKQFAARATKELKRIDVLLENAGMTVSKFEITEDDESTITTNVVSTFLLALLMLPKLRETSHKYNVTPRLTVVSSDLHFMTSFRERNADNIFEKLNDKETANMSERSMRPQPSAPIPSRLTPSIDTQRPNSSKSFSFARLPPASLLRIPRKFRS